MKAYAMFQETVFDEMQFESYKQVSSVTIENHGGIFLARGGKFKVLEGETPHTRFVIIQFPSWANAMKWYNSADYYEAKKMRLEISSGNMVLVEGN